MGGSPKCTSHDFWLPRLQSFGESRLCCNPVPPYFHPRKGSRNLDSPQSQTEIEAILALKSQGWSQRLALMCPSGNNESLLPVTWSTDVFLKSQLQNKSSAWCRLRDGAAWAPLFLMGDNVSLCAWMRQGLLSCPWRQGWKMSIFFLLGIQARALLLSPCQEGGQEGSGQDASMSSWKEVLAKFCRYSPRKLCPGLVTPRRVGV